MDEGLDRLLAVVAAVGQQTGDLLVADGLVKAIAAQQEHIAGLQRIQRLVDAQFLGRTYRTGNDVGQRMAMRIFGGNQTLIDQILDMAVIAGHLLQLTIAQAIDAAVTHPQAGALRVIGQ